MSKPGSERFHLVFISQPGDDVPAVSRLKRLLKAALRGYRLRCAAAWIENEAGDKLPLPADADQEHAHEDTPP